MDRMKLKKFIVYVIASAALVFIGCSKDMLNDNTKNIDGSMASPLGPNFNSLFENIFSKISCKSCHRPGGASGVNLDFTSADNAYNDLLNRGVEIPSNPSQCQTVRRVVSGQPGSSYLMGVLFNDYNKDNFAGVSGCRPNVAHLSQVNLSAAEKTALEGWIRGGAAR